MPDMHYGYIHSLHVKMFSIIMIKDALMLTRQDSGVHSGSAGINMH